MRKADIASRTAELTDVKPGHKAYLGFYQKAASELMNELSEEDKEKYQALADQWNGEGPPEEVKLE